VFTGTGIVVLRKVCSCIQCALAGIDGWTDHADEFRASSGAEEGQFFF
jgi:hypothetical protein